MTKKYYLYYFIITATINTIILFFENRCALKQNTSFQNLFYDLNIIYVCKCISLVHTQDPPSRDKGPDILRQCI